MLTAYFDDSGTDRANRAAVVAGYLGSDLHWRRFCPRWNAALDKEGVSVVRRSLLENFKGEFVAWDEERRKRFVKSLHRILKDCSYTAVATAVIKTDFDAVMPDWAKRTFGGPYGWCAHMCVNTVRGWSEEHRHPNEINWVFESGTKGSGEILEMFKALEINADLRAAFRVRSFTFAGKDIKPLQAADIISYEVFKQVENQALDGGNKRPVRISIRDLLRKNEDRYMTYWDKDRLTEWLRDYERRLPSLIINGL